MTTIFAYYETLGFYSKQINELKIWRCERNILGQRFYQDPLSLRR